LTYFTLLLHCHIHNGDASTKGCELHFLTNYFCAFQLDDGPRKLQEAAQFKTIPANVIDKKPLEPT